MTDNNNYFDPTFNTFHNQSLKDATVENALEIPEIAVIFENANPGEYFQQILSIAIHQHYVLEKIEKALHS